MSYIPITPFGRPIDATLLKHQRYADTGPDTLSVNKYDIMRKLTAARELMNVSSRELGVLQALLSFYPKAELVSDAPNLVVYPSNASICERMNGIACSTMRRHLAGLVEAGLILRRDSPNGKRFIKRSAKAPQAFGFDLTPLLARSAEIEELASTAQAQAEAYARIRRSVSLMRRDLAALAAYGAETDPTLQVWDAFSDLAILSARALRKRLTSEELITLQDNLRQALDDAGDLFEPEETPQVSSNDTENEHHHQNSNKEYEYKPATLDAVPEIPDISIDQKTSKRPDVPFRLVVQTCKELQSFSPQPVQNWQDLTRAARIVCPMMGIKHDLWQAAVNEMGSIHAAIVIACLLERFTEIKSVSAYLTVLIYKSAQGKFGCGPMLMALAQRNTRSSQL